MGLDVVRAKFPAIQEFQHVRGACAIHQWGERLARLACVAVVVFGFAAPAAAADEGVLKVRLGGDQFETRIVVDLDRPTSGKLGAEGLAEHQISLNLPGIGAKSVQQGGGQGLVKAWSVEPYGLGARLKLNLRAGATVKRRFLLPPADGVTNYRYVIDLAAAPGGTGVATVPAPAAHSPLVRLISLPTNNRVSLISLKKTVVIDAGHGGRDPGAHGAAGVEKDVTLAAARALRTKLERLGRYRVVMTRDSDLYVPLDTRVQIARRADADLFISLHADSGPDVNTRGASVYTLADRAAGRSAKLVTKDDWFMKASLQGDRGVSGILYDLTQRATKNRSASFAELLLDRVSEHQTLLRRSHREAGLAVLLAPDVPAVLLEMGFITSPEDEAILGDASGRGRLMGSVADSIDAYFAQETRLASR